MRSFSPGDLIRPRNFVEAYDTSLGLGTFHSFDDIKYVIYSGEHVAVVVRTYAYPDGFSSRTLWLLVVIDGTIAWVMHEYMEPA